MGKCKRCNQVPECGPVECEVCKQVGCDYCVPETDCGHSICFRCLETLEDQARKKAAERIAELEVETADLRKQAALVAPMLEALTFYAQQVNYEDGAPGNLVGTGPVEEEWQLDNGDIARAALAQKEG